MKAKYLYLFLLRSAGEELIHDNCIVERDSFHTAKYLTIILANHLSNVVEMGQLCYRLCSK